MTAGFPTTAGSRSATPAPGRKNTVTGPRGRGSREASWNSAARMSGACASRIAASPCCAMAAPPRVTPHPGTSTTRCASGTPARSAGAARRCHPGRAQDHRAGGAQGTVAVTGNPDLPRSDAASSSHSALTYYGELVRRQWQGCLPDVYQQIRDPGAFFAVLGEVIAQRIDELADYLAGDDPPGEGYLAKVARLTAARDRAKGRVLGEYLLLPPDEDRPVVVDRGHPSWAEVDAEQRERLGDPLSEEGRP